ncbi:hypothetical protein fugu_006342 [Takifugu bimaculatus]|uniref:SH2 domain-containing protein n=1 Tax=Takifugu bimaculatus TaxID=433685 RepID=A0A4Z2B6W4_9TELE|nr:hypothetical protein fugu_006342 [Takifugu bimaculatus]
MMAEGRFASLPRSLHTHHSLGAGSSHPGVPSSSLCVPGGGSCSSRRLQASLVTSMDLLGTRPGLPPGQDGSLSDGSAAACQPVSIHGTLPRRKKGGAGHAHRTYTWDPRSNQASRFHQPPTSPLAQDNSEEFHPYREPAAGPDATVDYVKFSRDQFILECPSEKLRKELEEELKMDCEELRSHAWYHGAIPRQRDGDFLIRDSLSSPGSYVLTSQWRNTAQHFKINKKVVTLNEAYTRVEFRLDREGFDNVPALIRYYVGNRKPVSPVVGAIIFQPINRVLPLRCLEEKYGVSNNHRERLMAQERRSQKRLSLNITNGHAHDGAHAIRDGSACQDNGHAGQLRTKDRCGSQPASLNQVHDRRRPLKAHQSESYLPLGSKPQPPPLADSVPLSPSHKSPVFRTGSEPVLSPSVPRRSAELLSGQPIRGSDSQLCPKPPPKPSKVLLSRLCPPADPPSLNAPQLDSPCAETPALPRRTGAPPGSPSKPLKFHHQLQPAERSLGSSHSGGPPADPLRGSEAPAGLYQSNGAFDLQAPLCGHVERLRREEVGEGEAAGRRGLDRSSYHHASAPLEYTSEEEEEDRKRKTLGFLRPIVETESTFRPADFGSRLLPAENKPLEMSVLKRAKELLLSHDHQSIARHLLKADCQVARIIGVTPELKHHTMAIGVAVDILGCTGSVDERATTLNRIILVALELKDAVGDLFAFTALMKALDLPQISRLEETWTTLRRNYTQTAISYEKTLKPFFKNLYEGTASCPPTVCVPVLLPLLTLMERSSVMSEGAELWETNDQGCDIMLRHLEAARGVAHNTRSYAQNAEKMLQEFRCDDELLEVFKTDFQLRLLWGSRGACVNQSDRYNKFNLILTALSRKLEPPPKTQTVI